MNMSVLIDFGNSESILISIKNRTITIESNNKTSYDLLIGISKENFENLILGKVKGKDLFISGKMKSTGDFSKLRLFEELSNILVKYSSISSKL